MKKIVIGLLSLATMTAAVQANACTLSTQGKVSSIVSATRSGTSRDAVATATVNLNLQDGSSYALVLEPTNAVDKDMIDSLRAAYLANKDVSFTVSKSRCSDGNSYRGTRAKGSEVTSLNF